MHSLMHNMDGKEWSLTWFMQFIALSYSLFVWQLQVIPMLNHPNDRVGAEVLAFLSVFMYDGNEVVQVKSMMRF